MFYAGILKEMAQDTMQLSRFRDEFGYVIQYMNKNREFVRFLNSTDISRELKYQCVESTFDGKVNNQIINFFKLLIEENIHSNINEIYFIIQNDSVPKNYLFYSKEYTR